MRKAYLLMAACLVTGIMSCDKAKHLGEFTKDFGYTQTVDMPGVPGNPDTIPPGGISAYLPVVPLITNAQQNIQGAGTSTDLVKTVKLTKFSATMKEPANRNFDFIDTLRMYISANGLPEVLVAHKYGIPKGQQKVDLDCEDTNLKSYFMKDTMYVRFGGHFVDAPDSAKIELSSTFTMLADLLGE